jgi:Stress responsive A/B Barrel Domain
VKMMMMICAVLCGVLGSVALTAFGADASGGGARLRHVVAFKFKDTASKEDVTKVEKAFKALKEKIPAIHSYFKSEKDRDDYLVHPDHKKFGELVGPLLGDVFVIDFWARD